MDDEPRIESPEEAAKGPIHGHAAVSLYGDNEQPPIQHEFEGRLSHATWPQQPLVHMVTWESERSCHVDLSGQVVLAGDEKAPLPVRVTHYFDDMRCKVEVAPLSHSLEVAPLKLEVEPLNAKLDVAPLKLEVEPLCAQLEVAPLSHKLEVEPLSHRLEVETLSHKLEVEPLKLDLEPLSHHLKVEQFGHTMDVSTALAMPIHHALQMRTPLQVRFCNTWHVASDYVVDIKMGDRSLFSIHLTGATVATPQPCPEEEPCPPPMAHPGHP